MAERLAVNQEVGGSNPPVPVMEYTLIDQHKAFVRGTEELYKWREANRMVLPDAEHIQKYIKRRWHKDTPLKTWAPGEWCVQRDNGYEMRISRGLLPRLFNTPSGILLNEDEQKAYWNPAGSWLAAHPRYSELRDYQTLAFQAAWLAGWGRIAFATNAGKGAVIALLAQYAEFCGQRITILCDELSVYDALLGELDAWGGIEPHCLSAGSWEIPTARVVLAMIPTLAKRLGLSKQRNPAALEEQAEWRNWLASQNMLLLDEADKATADTWSGICKEARNTRWRIGFSGTFPTTLTYEDWLLEDLMGPILGRQKNIDLIERGISANPEVELRGFDVTPAFKHLPSWEEWKALMPPARRLWAYETGLIFNQDRHTFIKNLVRPDTPTAVIVNRIDHGNELSNAFQGSAYFLDGSASETERRQMLDDFQAGGFPVLIATKILDRGTNRLGHAQDIIFASGEGSDRQTLQRIGRGLRRTGGKASLRLVDVIDRVEVDPVWGDKRLRKVADFLHDAGRKRLELYQSEGFDVEVIQ